MPFTRINDVTLHHAVDGPDDAALTLIFANSLGTDFRIWDGVRARLQDRVGTDLRLVFYDERGHGLSDLGPQTRMEDNVADMTGLLDALGAGPTVICGVSVGGLIAQGAAAARPDQIKALVLCDTAARIGTAEMWQPRIDAVRGDGLPAIADGILERWFPPAFAAARPDDFAGYRNMLIRSDREGYARMCEALRDTDHTAQTATITLPTLCLVGSEDGATPPEVVAGLAALIPGARLSTIDGAGHLPGIDRPDEVAALIAAHLDTLS